jgi:Icc-related predicted phosphoesterase
VRIAAVGDVHLGKDARGHLRPALAELPDVADVLLLAGDLTRHGTLAEAECVVTEFADLGVPVVAVLGNHDYHSDRQDAIAELLTEAGLTVLEGDSTLLRIGGERLAVAGVKGFGHGFAGTACGEFGEPETKAYAAHGRMVAASLAEALDGLQGTADRVVALTHYSPVEDTLVGERPELFPFLGNYLLAEVIDAAGVDLAIHGHAHAGTEKGVTAGGTRVRNVAQPVLDRAYAVYEL